MRYEDLCAHGLCRRGEQCLHRKGFSFGQGASGGVEDGSLQSDDGQEGLGVRESPVSRQRCECVLCPHYVHSLAGCVFSQPLWLPGAGPLPQLPARTPDKHVLAFGTKRPVVPLSGVVIGPGDLHEAFV